MKRTVFCNQYKNSSRIPSPRLAHPRNRNQTYVLTFNNACILVTSLKRSIVHHTDRQPSMVIQKTINADSKGTICPSNTIINPLQINIYSVAAAIALKAFFENEGMGTCGTKARNILPDTNQVVIVDRPVSKNAKPTPILHSSNLRCQPFTK